jgi:hypothetical protein
MNRRGDPRGRPAFKCEICGLFAVFRGKRRNPVNPLIGGIGVPD